jgi:hypothetical protein
VGGVLHGEVPALDAALEALTLGFARHVNLLTGFKTLYGQLGTDFRRLIGVFQAELPQTNTRFDTRLGEMSRLGFTPPLRLLELMRRLR